MSLLQGLGVTECLVAPEKETEDVTHEDLLAVGGVGQTLNQLEGSLHLAVHFRRAGIDDLARDVDRLVQFVEAKAPVVVV